MRQSGQLLVYSLRRLIEQRSILRCLDNVPICQESHQAAIRSTGGHQTLAVAASSPVLGQNGIGSCIVGISVISIAPELGV